MGTLKSTLPPIDMAPVGRHQEDQLPLGLLEGPIPCQVPWQRGREGNLKTGTLY